MRLKNLEVKVKPSRLIECRRCGTLLYRSEDKESICSKCFVNPPHDLFYTLLTAGSLALMGYVIFSSVW